MKNKTRALGTEPIGRLIAQYSIPSVIAMVVNAIYNVVDRIFIGQLVGEAALASLTIAFPIMMTTFAFAALIGAGGAALMSIKLGERDEEGASHVFGNTLGTGFLVIVATVCGLLFNLQSILTIFGANSEVLGLAEDYMKIILPGAIIQTISFILNNTVRTEGNPMLPMKAMITSALTNIVLDYFFIAHFEWGVEGAALATVIGQTTGLIILLSFYFKKQSHLKLKVKDFIPELRIVGSIATIGFATFIGTVGNSVSITFMNRALSLYGGTGAITSMGAINSLFTICIMPLMGIQQGLQPIMGYNHGADNNKRVYKTLGLGTGVAVAFATIVFIVLQSFPVFFISMFIDSSSPTMPTAVTGLRYFILLLPVISINIIGTAFFQSTNRGKTALWLSMLRQFFFLIPLVLILPRFIALTGVWAATPLADGLSVLITLLVVLADFKRHGKEEDARAAEEAPRALRA